MIQKKSRSKRETNMETETVKTDIKRCRKVKETKSDMQARSEAEMKASNMKLVLGLIGRE
jgi:hypothetical protein